MSSHIYPDTHDMRRINNSDAKTLLQNWVEEREVQRFDRVPEDYNQAQIKYFHSGHQGILTINEQASSAKATTYKDDFIDRDSYDANGEAKGIRYKLTEQMLMGKILDQMDAEENLKNDFYDEPTSYVSEAHEHFNKPGFVSVPPKPIAKHDLYSEMPVSYWTEQKRTLQGTTQMKTLDTPFRKNAAFSTPVELSMDNAPPGEMERNPYLSQKSNNTGAIM